jgi:acetyl-CoA carboxylase carboxyltransferase component
MSSDKSQDEALKSRRAAVMKGGAQKYHQKNAETGKGFARDRIARLLDAGTFVEDGLLANQADPDLPADGVVTGLGKLDGRRVAVMANDSTVKAGSWGAPTARKHLHLIGDAGSRRVDQVEQRAARAWPRW